MQEKLQLRLKVLEEGLKSGNGTIRRATPVSAEPKRSSSVTSNGSMRQSSGTEEGSKLLANGSRTRRSAVTQLRAMSNSPLLKNGRMTSISFDGGRSFDGGSLPRVKAFTNGFEEVRTGRKSSTEAAERPAPASPKPRKTSEVTKTKAENTAPPENTTPPGNTAPPENTTPPENTNPPENTTPQENTTPAESTTSTENTAPAENVAPAVDGETDTVSGVLYDMLQKEVINLRKAMHEKDQSLKDKDDAIEVHLIVQ